MKIFSYDRVEPKDELPAIGLIVLQADETIENEFRRWLPADQCDLYVSRIPSGDEVTTDTLSQMAENLKDSASLFPKGRTLDVVAYCCTSGSSVIGLERVESLVRQGCDAKHVTNPSSALIATCKRQNIKRLAFLSPYVESVSDRLRQTLADHGIETPLFGSFDEAEERNVVRISGNSVCAAAYELVQEGDVDALFMSCTNLKTFGIIEKLSAELSMPVLSSNWVLAGEITILAGLEGDLPLKANFKKVKSDV